VVQCLALGFSLQFTWCSGSQTVVCKGFQGGGWMDLLFLEKNYIHSYNFYLLDSVNKFLNFCVLRLLALKWPQKFLQQFCSCRNCFQTFDQMIFGTLTFPGTRWQVLTVRDPQMVHDQNKFGKHWLNASIKQEAANCLLTLKPWQRSSMHGTELLQMSCSDKQNMHSKLISCLLQPILLSWRQNNSSSHFAS